MRKLLYDNSFAYRGTRHLLFFSLTVLLFSVILYSQNNSGKYFHFLLVTFINAIFFFGYAYLTIFLLIPEFLIKKKIGIFILLFVLVGFGLSAVKLLASGTIFYASISPENMTGEEYFDLRLILVNTKDMSFIVAVFCIAKYIKDFIYAERIRSNLEQQQKAAQKKLLGSQFDPHFMFNTINNLYALSLLNPGKTREVIFRIKIVLNYIIDESQKEFVDLAQEISLVENYIQLEKLRYGKRLKVSFDWVGEVENTRIPPMILFFLVENCFKHGSSLDAGVPWIQINVRVENDKIRLTTENSKPRSVIEKKGNELEGEGFKNLVKRLKILYTSEGYSLRIENHEDIFKVDLELLTKHNVEILQTTYR
ncbi:sensor histidine kinase [Maribellus sediminis]|uniref:sensor histidine kinase n=1 Tax=Maribellus sediminis TaxID=2696285 RepID=UPI001431D4CA|nr:histidine kinase [Maribellus sediminis]